jgi:hypothetical protein
MSGVTAVPAPQRPWQVSAAGLRVGPHRLFSSSASTLARPLSCRMSSRPRWGWLPPPLATPAARHCRLLAADLSTLACRGGSTAGAHGSTFPVTRPAAAPCAPPAWHRRQGARARTLRSVPLQPRLRWLSAMSTLVLRHVCESGTYSPGSMACGSLDVRPREQRSQGGLAERWREGRGAPVSTALGAFLNALSPGDNACLL